ncbi:hypothetical protein HanPI659440_Chr16g0635871 [Helianthus annuus]|nr:hypothetical protein HanPI659440_Chr16g0635871 [Helianthus annuus]
MASSLKNTSTAMSAVNSSTGIPPLPPPPAGSQKNAEKRPTSISSKPSSSALTSSVPSTSDIFTLILQMRDRMQQQDETNDRILREIGDLKRQKKTAEDHSPLTPKSLNFDTPMITSQPSEVPDIQYMGGSRGVHFGPATMTQASGSYFPTGGILRPAFGILHELRILLCSRIIPDSRILLRSRIILGSRILLRSRIIPGSRILLCSRIIPGSRILLRSRIIPGSRILLRPRIIPDSRIPTDTRILEEFANRKPRCPSRRFYSNADHCFHWSIHYPRIPAIWIHTQCS